MQTPDQTFNSIDSLKWYEARTDWADEQRFKDELARLAKDNPELTEWLEANGGRLV